MNALKAFVVMFVIFFSTTTSAATVVTVSVVPGKSVGLDDAGYFAGFVTLNINGKEYPAMATNWLTTFVQSPSTVIGQWSTTLYTQDDILAGGTSTTFVPEYYTMAAQVFLSALLGYSSNDSLWAAGHNEMTWNALSPTVWEYSNRVYDAGSGMTLHDIYNSYVASGLDPSYDYSGFMSVLAYGGVHEFFVYTVATPIPPAIWLLSSGLLGLIAVARKK